MKTSFSLFIIMILLFAGCSKDAPVESEFNKLKNAHADIPANLDLTFVPDFTFVKVQCTPIESNILLPAKHWIKGTFEYLGKIDDANSYVLNKGCEAVDAKHLKEIFEGRMSDTNNNTISFNGWVLVDISNAFVTAMMPVDGEIKVTSGTGMFAGVSGSIKMNGTLALNNGLMNWKGDGYIAFKSN